MTSPSQPSNGQTPLAYILGVRLAPSCQRQWPQMEQVVCGRDLIGQVEGNFPGEPTTTPEWRQAITDRLEMPADGTWKDAQHLTHH